jgi:hypothetical protein
VDEGPLQAMSEDSQRIANFRVHLVPAVLALGSTPWQRVVWLDPSTFDNAAAAEALNDTDADPSRHPCGPRSSPSRDVSHRSWSRTT